MANDSPACFNRTTAAWVWNSGLDISGKSPSRNFTSLSGVSATTLNGIAAGGFTTSSSARLSNPSFLSLSDLSVEFLIQLTALPANTTGLIFRAGSLTTVADFGCIIRLLPNTSGDLFWSCIKLGNLPGETGSTAEQTTNGDDPINIALGFYHVVVVFQSGVNNKIYINGGEIPVSHSYLRHNANGTVTPIAGGVLSGPIPIKADYELAIGDPSLTDRVGFNGKIGRVIAYPYPLIQPQPAASYRVQVDGPLFPTVQRLAYNIGKPIAAGTSNHSPVAVPDTYGPVNTGVAIDIPVAVRGFDADGDAKTAVLHPTPPSQGVSVLASGLLRYTPNTGTGGGANHTVPQRISTGTGAGIVTSDSIVRVRVTTSSEPPTDDYLPENPATAKARYDGDTYWVGPGKTGIKKNGRNDPGNFFDTIQGVPDKSRIMCLPGNYGNGNHNTITTLSPLGGNQGFIMIEAENHPFTSLDLSDSSGGMVGFNESDASKHSVITNKMNFNHRGLWLEGFRLGVPQADNNGLDLSPTLNAAKGYNSDGLPYTGPGRIDNSPAISLAKTTNRNWILSNMFNRSFGQMLLIGGNQDFVVYNNYLRGGCRTVVYGPGQDRPANTPAPGFRNDYFIFIDGAKQTTYIVSNFLRAGSNQAVGIKSGSKDVIIRGNVWDTTIFLDNGTSNVSGGSMLLVGQDPDFAVDQSTNSVLISNNIFAKSGAGRAIQLSNVVTAVVENNTFDGAGSDTTGGPGLVVFANASKGLSGSTVRAPHPGPFTVRKNTINGAWQWAFGKYYVNGGTNVIISDNTASITYGSSLGDLDPLAGPHGPDYDPDAKILLDLQTNSKCNSSGASSRVTLV